MQQEAAIREPLILGNKNYKDITDDVVGPIPGPGAPMGWKIMITISSIIAVLRRGVHPVPLRDGHWCVGTQ